MKTRTLIFFILFICSNSFGQENKKISLDTLYHIENGEKIYLQNQVDSMPKYGRDDSEFFAYISENLKYPSDAKDKGIQGKVYVSFIIEKDNSISDIIIIRGLNESCDNEVKRLISNLPNKWRAAYKAGKPVRFQFVLPLMFKLTDSKGSKGKRD